MSNMNLGENKKRANLSSERSAALFSFVFDCPWTAHFQENQVLHEKGGVSPFVLSAGLLMTAREEMFQGASEENQRRIK